MEIKYKVMLQSMILAVSILKFIAMGFSVIRWIILHPEVWRKKLG